MNNVYWLGIAYGLVFGGLALYLVSLALRQRRLVLKLEELEGNNDE